MREPKVHIGYRSNEVRAILVWFLVLLELIRVMELGSVDWVLFWTGLGPRSETDLRCKKMGLHGSG